MNIPKFFSAAAVIITLTATSAFAASNIPATNGSCVGAESKHDKKDIQQKMDEFSKDPIKALEKRKEEIQSLLKEGKITKEKADEKIARIDSKIKEIQSFDRLTVPQKKDKLINDCKSYIEKQVKEGRLDKAKADTILNNCIEKINKWDGKGYPQFHHHFKGKCKKDSIGN